MHTPVNHFGVDGGDEDYSLNLNISVNDNDGLGNIDSVIVTGPDGTTQYVLYDDGQHCDNVPNDGHFTYNCDNIFQTPPASGTYTFTIRDKDGTSNTATAEISGKILDIPRNLSPADKTGVPTSIPTFSWSEVFGASGYNIDVRKSDDNLHMWGRWGIAGPSVGYNDDGAGEELVEDTVYQWGVGAYDDEGNSSWHHTTSTFVYSTTGKPIIVSPPVAGTMHWGVDGKGEQYGLNLQIEIIDTQGLDNIDSVVVTGPDGTIQYVLYDDGQHCDNGPNDGRFGHDCSAMSQMPPVAGTYTFTIKDKDGNSVNHPVVISKILDIPRNVSPQSGTFVDTLTPTFSWGEVDGAARYNLGWCSTCSGISDSRSCYQRVELWPSISRPLPV